MKAAQPMAAKLCFASAIFSAVFAAAFAAAQTTYPDQYCFSTPHTPYPSQCGCPVSTNKNDFCDAVKPPAGQTEMPFYYCVEGSSFACTSPNKSCGGSANVVRCDCWTCDGSGGQCGPQVECNPTQGKIGACTNYYGCTDNRPQ